MLDLRGRPVGRHGARRVRRAPARVVANQPIYVITLARPELADRHPGWGSSSRRFSSLFLEPLTRRGDRRAAARASCPGLPDEGARADPRPRRRRSRSTRSRRSACCSTAALLERDGDEYRPIGPIDALDVPETLQALIAARLDGLDPEERRLLGDAIRAREDLQRPRARRPLGPRRGNGRRPSSTGLVRKEVLAIETDPRSPERGQYGFLQALVQRVAYDTLSRPTGRRNTSARPNTSRTRPGSSRTRSPR